MLSIIDTGPKDTATAYIPKDAAVPADVSAKLTRHMQSSIPIPQMHTIAQSAHNETLFEKKKKLDVLTDCGSVAEYVN